MLGPMGMRGRKELSHLRQLADGGKLLVRDQDSRPGRVGDAILSCRCQETRGDEHAGQAGLIHFSSWL